MQWCWYLLIMVSYYELNISQASLLDQENNHQFLERRSIKELPDNTGNEFFIGFMDNYIKPAFQNIQSLIINQSTLFIVTTNPSGALTMIESEQGTTLVNVLPDMTLSRTIEQFKVQSGRDRNRGIKVKAEQSTHISLYALNEELHSVDGFTALPCSHLPSVSSYVYYAVSVPPSTVSMTTADSAFLIVACSDNTTVTITPTQDIEHPYIQDQSVTAGTTFTVQLSKRETLYIQDREDLTGSKVESSKPISFFTGHECGNVPADIAECDHLVEQIPPTVTWGEQFIVAPTATRTANGIIKIVASEEVTLGKISCIDLDGGVDKSTFVLPHAASFHNISIPSDNYCFIETDKPVLVVQFTPGRQADSAANGDPFMVLVPAFRQYLLKTTFPTVTGIGLTFTHYINIAVPSTSSLFDPSSILLDDEPLDTENWVAIPCFDDESTCGYAAVTNITNGLHTILNSDNETPIGLTVYGLYYLETYAYVGGLKLSLPDLDPDQEPTSHFVLSGSSICMPCHEIEHTRATVNWIKDDESPRQMQHQRITNDGFLCIDNATMDDAGNYTCYMFGEPYPHQLSVIGGIIVEPPTCSSADKGALVGVGRGTYFIDSSTVGVQICCRVQGPEGTTVEWLLDGDPVHKGASGYMFSDDNLHYSGPLTLGCVTYTCQANFSLSLPLASESAKVCIGVNSAPVNVTITGETTLTEHSSVTYQCSADGFPAPLKVWTADRDTQKYLPDGVVDHKNGTLTIDSVTEQDGRWKFCCDVSNSHGQQYECINLNVLISPELVKEYSLPMIIISVPFGTILPLEIPQNITITIGQNIMIPETFNLEIECLIHRANPTPFISWLHENITVTGRHSQYTVRPDGTLGIEGIVRGRDDGQYTCIANSPGVGSDESNSTVIVTVPPEINSSILFNGPGNCLDLTETLQNVQQVGKDLCVRAGISAILTLKCEMLQGVPTPDVMWLKDGKNLNDTLALGVYENTISNLTIMLPADASSASKRAIEGNYSCVAINSAGIASASSYVALFGDIPLQSATTEFVVKQSNLYQQLHQTVSEYFPGVESGTQQLMFFSSGRVLSYEEFDPGYQYDDSEESILPQTMENMFDLVDVIPNGGSIVFNPNRAQRLQETYSELVNMLHVAPSSLKQTEQQEIRDYLLETVADIGSSTNDSMPRLSRYLLYKNAYYATVFEVDDLIESQQEKLFDWQFTQWLQRNLNVLVGRKQEALTKWKLFAEKDEVEEKLSLLELSDYSQDIYDAHVLIVINRRESRFKDENIFYLVKFYPDTWYKGLKNQVKESILQMQYKLTQLKTEIYILETTSRYLETESRRRDVLNALFPSLDPVFQLYCDLDIARLVLDDIVKESEDARYACLISGNPVDCNLYWGLKEYIRNDIISNYTEFYWYVHTVEAALNHREYSIPAIANSINGMQIRINRIQRSIDNSLSDFAERDGEDLNNYWGVLSEFEYTSDLPVSDYDFELPDSIVGRLMWYINPESTALVLKELAQEYNLTVNHMNTAVTNVTAKFRTVNIHRRWFKAALFSNQHLSLINSDILVSPGIVDDFRQSLKNDTYQLPLYPTSLLLATDIKLSVDVPFIFHTLPTLIKLSYDPHVAGGFGPFSFGQMYKGNTGGMKFRVGIRDNKLSITLPGTQLIGYVCDVVSKHPREPHTRHRRTTRSVLQEGESQFDQWLFKKMKKASTSKDLDFNDADNHKLFGSLVSSVGEHINEHVDLSQQLRISPTHPLHSSIVSTEYSFSSNSSITNLVKDSI